MEENYFVVMDPNYLGGVALIKMEFEEDGFVSYFYADDEGEFHPLTEDEWALVPHQFLVEVNESITDVWPENRPVDVDIVSKHLV